MKRWMMIGLLIGMSGVSLYAQESDKLRLSGSIQSDMLLAQRTVRQVLRLQMVVS